MRSICFHSFLRQIALLCALAASLPDVTRAETPAPAKPLHFSLTEAIYDREHGRLRLNVRVQTADLEAVLSERAHHKISAADPGVLAPLALEYVREKLRLKSARGEPLRLEWAGLDMTDTQLFLFFETSLIGSIQGTRVADTLLLERCPDQINSVEVRDGALKKTLVFGSDTGELAISTTTP
jgi:hypothetical protein